MDSYEKKYNEALERAREEILANPGLRKTWEEIFPELRESEDERIRKAIVKIVEQTELIDWNYNKKQMLSWLEKQKEQKPVEKQDYSGLNDLERAILRGFLCAGVENVHVTIIKETAQECLAQMKPADDNPLDDSRFTEGFDAGRTVQKIFDEPKPAEWSEEDKEILDSVIRIITHVDDLAHEPTFAGPKWTHPYTKELAWLKSLRPSWKPSEEQMEALNKAVNKLAKTDVADSVRLSIMYDNLKKL